jgi:hypothetical protein
MLDTCPPDAPVSESEIVNYADKRVLHDQVVSLEKRLAYIQVRYGANPEFKDRIQRMWSKTLVLEQKLFKQLPFEPSRLSDLVMPVIEKE